MKHDELILVLEDDRLLNRLLRGELERMGYAAEGAHGWAEAREALAGRQFGLTPFPWTGWDLNFKR